MSMPFRLAVALFATSAIVAPSVALAQSTDTGVTTAPAPTAGNVVGETAQSTPQENVDVSVPGGEIVVVGTRNRDIARTSNQVLSVLGAADIARTGEGNIAGALGRVTGLSVVGSGFVFVRGLGDRYSLALLNGSPLPSPEPLRRVVPLDLFPSGIIASSLVQKSYSVNYPGEFGGGVINLTTRAVPREPFLTIGAGISGDSETTFERGYTYYGSKLDDTGFDNGNRDIPPALAAYFASGARLSSGTVNAQAIAGQLINGRNAVVQGWDQVAPNSSFNATAGKSWPLGGGDIGVIAAAGYSNRYLTRDIRQQSSLSADLSTLESDFRQVNTDQRIVVNGLLGLGYEWDDNKIRLTGLYVRDTIKQARLALGNRQQTNVDFLQQRTGWFERQLIDLQLVEELKVADGLSLDIRAGYANSQREAPDETLIEYARTNSASDPTGAFFVNRLSGNLGDARIVFSDLNEDLYSASADLTYRIADGYTATIGGAYSDTKRDSSRRGFRFRANGLPAAVGLFRPDLLLQPSVINFYGITLDELDEAAPAFFAELKNYAGYVKLNAQFLDNLGLDIGVRYEKAKQTVRPIPVFADSIIGGASTNLDRDYFLPAATLTFQATPELQFRLNASKTIARPQFRELIAQPFFDPESNRTFFGNPLLVDSQLYNAEVRGEYYFGRDQRIAVSGFYKRIDRPIEGFNTISTDVTTSFANAPKANLYGAEFEVQKNFDLDGLFASGPMSERRFIVIGNYTYTKSKLKIGSDDQVRIPGIQSGIASNASIYFRDGAPLTGQSDHIANVQFGLEHPDRLSQQNVLLSYSSKRVISRGLNGTPPQPDVIERPGFRVDFVAREGFDLAGHKFEAKFEARNITGRKHEEFQQSGSNRIDTNTYDLGTTLALGVSVNF